MVSISGRAAARVRAVVLMAVFLRAERVDGCSCGAASRPAGGDAVDHAGDGTGWRDPRRETGRGPGSGTAGVSAPVVRAREPGRAGAHGLAWTPVPAVVQAP